MSSVFIRTLYVEYINLKKWEEFVTEKGVNKCRFVGTEEPNSPYMNKNTNGVVKSNPHGKPVYIPNEAK